MIASQASPRIEVFSRPPSRSSAGAPGGARARLLVDDGVQAMGQTALVQPLEGAKQAFGRHQAQHTVAEEFEALVGRGAPPAVTIAGMGQRAFEKRVVTEMVADMILKLLDPVTQRLMCSHARGRAGLAYPRPGPRLDQIEVRPHR